MGMMLAKDQPRWQRALVGCIAILGGIVLMIGGFDILADVWHYINQEYLHLWSSNVSVRPSNPH